MTRREALYAALIAISLITAGLTWRFGFYGLVGPGAAVLVSLVFIRVKEDNDDA